MNFHNKDGDLQIRVGSAFDSDDELSIGGGYISRAQAGELRDHLSGLLGATSPGALVEGREYRLLPGAGSGTNGDPESGFRDVTRVRLNHARPDPDGDVRVTLLDGTRADSSGWYVHAKFLAPLTAAAPEAKPAAAVEVGQEYRLLPGAAQASGRRVFAGGDVTRVHVLGGVDEDGDVRVRAEDGARDGTYAYVLPRYLAPLTDDAPKPAADIARAARETARMYHRATTSHAPDRRLYAHLGEAFNTFADKIEGKSL